VQNFQYYMMFEVIEPNWQLFESNMDTVCSLFSPKKGKGEQRHNGCEQFA